MSEAVNRTDSLDALHDALNHLYNADHLRKSSLAELFRLARRFDVATALRKLLVDAIEGIRPPAAEPAESRGWRIYESLYCCYVQQLNQQVVADQLCISPRQLRREQHKALEVLADHLWEKFDLDHADGTAEEPAGARQPESRTELAGELAWLREDLPAQAVRLETELESVLNLTHTIAFRSRVTVKNLVGKDLADLAVHPVVLNQLLVSLMSFALPYAAGGDLEIRARALRAMVELDLEVTRGETGAGGEEDSHASLEAAVELAHMSGCRLAVARYPEAPVFRARLHLPTREQVPVLVVDDNEDVLQLLRRYAAGSRYRLITTREPEQIYALVEQNHPFAIILDIMMPKENGWMVLGRLKQVPQTRLIPVIICTILPQEKLALTLGAASFLKKPVTRQAFLQMLDQVLAQQESEPA